MTLVCRISVDSVNSLISQKPKMAKHLYPGIIGFKSPPSFMFEAMIFDPASPKPKAKS
jgi:hypothetical protein